MAVSSRNDSDNKTRRISLNYIKESFVRRSTRQSRSRSHVFCSEKDENGEVVDSAVKCPKTCVVDKCSDKCLRGGNDKHRVGIFKNLKKRFLFSGSTSRPLKCKTKQTVKVLDSSCNSYSLSKNDEQSGEGFVVTANRKTKQIPPPLRLVQSDTNSDYSSSGTSSPPHRTITDQLPCNGMLSNDVKPPVAPRKDISGSPLSKSSNLSDTICNEGDLNIALLELSRHSDSEDHSSDDTTPTTSPTARSLTFELFQLAKYGWYWGPITREEAEEKLLDLPDGAFLVRDSSADRYLLSVSFRSSGKTLHSRIEYSHGLFSFYSFSGHEGFTSIVELINHSMTFSESAVFCYSRPRAPGYPAFPVRLAKPVSRFTQVRSLQYLCRFVIRQFVRVDNIEKLPLPSKLKNYIQEGHY